jgi:enoyl-CoA hydratase/carnithine racemase
MPYSVPDWVAGTALPWLKEEASVFGQGPLIVASVTEAGRLNRAELGASILVGVDESGAAPDVGDTFDIHLTTMPAPPRPWVHANAISETVETLQRAVAANPVAAATLIQVLRAQRGASFEEALHIESLAYSTLLGGAEFHRWRAANPVIDENQPRNQEAAVVVERSEDILRIELSRPENDNATTAEMRDALVEALRVAQLDETITTVEIRGRGRVFSSGGAFGEFGTAQDLAMAHQIRTVRSVALTLHQLGARSRVLIQGAAVGGGIEFAAAGHELIAQSSAFFQLPEISMGLIPGAGGTATVSRRIGWPRMAYLTLSGARLRARTAQAWGLIDRIDDA